jgi:amino acid transporter
MSVDMTRPPGPTVSDEQELAELGYQQELSRGLRFWTNWAIGFAFVSPIVGVYTIVALGVTTAGPIWWWVVPIAVVGQLLVAMVYAQLAVRWPIAGGIYQWSRHVGGPAYGWWAGWIYAWALFLVVAGTAYYGGLFFAELIGVSAPTTGEQIGFAFLVLAAVTAVNMIGLKVLKYTVVIGISAEIIASTIVVIALLGFHRNQSWGVLVDTSYVPAGKTVLSAFVAALAFAGWVILGFDASGSVAEETQNARRWVPKAIIMCLIPVGIVDILAAIALMMATPDMKATVSGGVADPVLNPISASLGSWIEKPFLAIIVIGYMSCSIAVQTTCARVVYSFGRDRMLPAGAIWSRVNRVNRLPVYAVALVAVLAALACVWTKGIAMVLLFSTGAYFIAFFMPIGGMLWQRWQGRWDAPRTVYSFGRFGLPIAVIASVWLVLEFINISWPRDLGGAWWETWAVPVGLAVSVGLGLLYFVLRRPDRHFTETAEAMKKVSEIDRDIIAAGAQMETAE